MSTIKLKGSSSGEAEVTVAAAAGTPTFTLPTTVGSANQLLKNSGTAGTLQYASTVEDSSGRVLMGTTTVSPANTYSDNLIVSEAGDAGISIRGTNSNSNYASIYFQDAGAASRAYFETQLGSNGVFSIGKSGTGNIRFVNNGAQRATIDSSGNLGLDTGNLVIGTSGKGIDFSAQTQSTSTTDEELLDHYEKGKWTPDVRKNNVSNATPTITHGRYVRIGKLVWLSMYVRWNSGSSTQSSGGWQILGVPFALQDDDPGTCRIYQSAPAGYMMVDCNDYAYADNPRWQVNYSDKLDLYTNTSNSDLEWNSGMMIVAFTGCFMIHE